MRSWLFMLGGLLVWAAHFLGVYALSSLAAATSALDGQGARAAVGLLTALSLLADAGLGLAAWRRLHGRVDDLDRFLAWGAGICAGLSAIAVLWQGLPALVER